MQSKELYERLLGLEKPWRVKSVDMDAEKRTVEVRVECRPGSTRASKDGRRLHVHGWEERGWRELNTLQFETRIVCKVPRVKDPETGKTETVSVPWAGKNSRFTLMFEAFAIEVLQASASVEAARKLPELDWRAVDAIRQRAVERGLSRREAEPFDHLGIDEKSFRRGHSYVSVCSDLDQGRVLEVARERTEQAAQTLMDALSQDQKDGIGAVAMDMRPPYMKAARLNAPPAFIVHDRFHAGKHLSEGVDAVRRSEDRRLRELGDESLKGLRWTLLKGSRDEEEKKAFAALEAGNMDAARAWNFRDLFDRFWRFKAPWAAERFFHRWRDQVKAASPEPMEKVADTLNNHLEGLLSCIYHPITNARAEGLNSKIQSIKADARGFRSFSKFRVAILFHCGKLDMIPR